MTPRAFVTEQVSLMLGAPVALTDAQIERFWAAMSREEEYGAPKDQHGNFTPERAELTHIGLLENPPLHTELRTLEHRQSHVPARWPHGARFACCLSHDVDRIVKLPWRERWRQMVTLWPTAPLRQRLRWALATGVYAAGALAGQSDIAVYDAWMAVEAQHGFHSTFFVLPERLTAPTTHDHFYRYTDQVRFHGRRLSFAEATRRVQVAGWEIGLHGSYASAFDGRIFAAEKAQLETMLMAPIRSTRQHYLRFDPQTTPGIQARAGIQVDSSLGFSTAIGCRAGLAFPYFWPHEPKLLEVPLIIQDVGLAYLHGGNIAQAAAIAQAQTLIRHIADVGGAVTLSWHTHPEAGGALECYSTLLDTVTELGGWGCSLGELNDWWRTRRQAYSPASPQHIDNIS